MKPLRLLAMFSLLALIIAATNGAAVPIPLSASALLLLGFLVCNELRDGRVSTQQQLVATVTAELQAQTATATQMTALAQEEAKKRTQTVEAIAIVEGERNKWKEMFINCALGHSAAQDMMLREREKLVLRLRQLGDKPEKYLSPETERMIAEFKAKYADPAALEKRDRIIAPVDKPAGHE
jgi:hypothetical protein